MWLLGIELMTSGRAASALNPEPSLHPWKSWMLMANIILNQIELSNCVAVHFSALKLNLTKAGFFWYNILTNQNLFLVTQYFHTNWKHLTHLSKLKITFLEYGTKYLYIAYLEHPLSIHAHLLSTKNLWGENKMFCLILQHNNKQETWGYRDDHILVLGTQKQL